MDAYFTPMVFRPAGAPVQLIVIGTTRLESYSVDTGEQRWWMPVGSMGAMGTAVASGDTLFVATLGMNEPWMPTFAATLEKLDKDKDGRISQQEFSVEKDWAEHFGFLDTDDDEFLGAKEWNEARNLGLNEHGAIAIRPGDARGQLDPKSVLWRFKKNLPYIPAPLLYQNVFYMVKDGGIINHWMRRPVAR